MSFKNLAKLVKQATESNSPAKEFQNMFERAVKLLEQQNKKQPSQTYKPSSLGGCMRKVYFEVTGAPVDPNPDIDPDLVAIAENGTDRHIRIQTVITKMKELGLDCEWIDVEEYLKKWPVNGTVVVERDGLETKLKNEILNLSFKCDGIIKFKGEYYILEIKTEASFKWNGRTDAEEKHKVQASAYSLALGINKVLFIYEQRDLCKKKYIVVEVTDQDKQEKVVDYINTVDDYVERSEVPPKTNKKSECNYCDYKQECKKW
jgi:CRISPR/Cas system-associated exonuclease Cas4 (RecB family)